jgi:UDP-N-acetylmuramoyl-tripeptide--D-alanyl-D-alanine ligase
VPELTAARVAKICGGRLVGDGSARARFVGADSRNSDRATAFAAVGGGHAFVADALARGAPFAIVERDEAARDRTAAVVVDDTVAALGALARSVRAELSVKVVAITGSVGKTLTKDFAAAILRTRYAVHAAPRSFNQELGVPLVVLSCPDDAEVMVCELGARHPGDIAYLAAMVRPHIGVITGIGMSHLEVFGSRDAIAATKSELLAALPADGVAIVPSDDDYLDVMSSSTRARVRTVGPGASISYRGDRVGGDGRTKGVVRIGEHEIDVDLPVAGRALMRNAALAIATGIELGVDPHEAAGAIAEAPLSSYRMQILDVGGWTLVNDAYNASPASVASALESVKEMSRGRPIWAILGPMAELGPASEAEHARVGRLAASLGYDGVIALGPEGGLIADAAGAIAMRVKDADEAADTVVRRVPPNSLVLVKASRVFSLERFPEILDARLDPAARKA